MRCGRLRLEAEYLFGFFKPQPSDLGSMAQSHSGPPWTMNWVYRTGPRVHGVFQGISFIEIIRKIIYCVINRIYSLKIIELIPGKCNFAFKPSNNILFIFSTL